MTRNLTREALAELKARLSADVALDRMILFGSRAREDFTESSDVDVVVIVKEPLTEEIEDKISESAWQVSFDYGLVIVPLVFACGEWDNGPMRHSLLAQAVLSEGLAI